MADKIHVLIADDHAIVRQGLKQILSETDDLVVTGEADDGAEALSLARQQTWDVFLLDVSMPNRNGIDTLKQLKKEFPRLPVLILSMHPEEQYAVRALKAGASGYLTKQSAPEQLVTAIRQVASGKKYLSPAVAQQLAEAISENTEKSPHERITDREYQVLVLISTGNTLDPDRRKAEPRRRYGQHLPRPFAGKDGPQEHGGADSLRPRTRIGGIGKDVKQANAAPRKSRAKPCVAWR
jgi:two-component system invasion response regulator UvrY